MELTKLVEDGAVIASLNASERGPVVRELLESLASAGRIDDSSVDPLHNAVMKRERKGSTGFGHGVAVPHAKSTMVDNIRIAVGLSPDGVEFNALDRQPVFVFFLLLSPEGEPELHLDAMETVFGRLSDDGFRRFLRQADSVEDIMTLISESDAASSG